MQTELSEPTAVQEVRQWRRQLAEGWKGKTREAIQAELNAAGREFQERMRLYQAQHPSRQELEDGS